MQATSHPWGVVEQEESLGDGGKAASHARSMQHVHKGERKKTSQQTNTLTNLITQMKHLYDLGIVITAPCPSIAARSIDHLGACGVLV